ncbi:GntR family transcriptional regulator [Virgisporangium aliadipatigenens]|uniref:GntR family transcriptional regulator n=1 Tax=Virgisporangium aliadipatigenens TaxID=741659 RepID=A0A8J3YPX3_9ACTN|nr:GntR family transcriptional regulator [Virgisporangium aliadipatigenens]GIJ47663.1 GntR family transcriptional regulator [Virgisporangium aliadipatigenens]
MSGKYVPAYEKIAALLRTAIESGEIAPGGQLPAVRDLAARYEVTPGTVSRAVGRLQALGLVTTTRGGGIYVRGFEPIIRNSPGRLARDRWGTGATIQDADTGKRSRTVDVETGERVAPDWVAAPLGLADGAVAAFRSRRFVVEDRYVQLSVSWMPAELVRGTAIMHTDTGPGGMYARLAELGHAPATFVERVRTRMPTRDEEERLELLAGTPVFEITRHATTEAGRCVEVNRMTLDGRAYVLDYTFPA